MTELRETSFPDVSSSQLEAMMIELYDDNECILKNVLANSQLEQQCMVQGTTGSTSLYPCSDVWEGPLSFSVDVTNNSASRTSWLYSSELSKVFILMNSSLPVHFKCQFDEPDLYVRAVPIFLGMDDRFRPVTRCSHHASHDTENNEDFPYPSHVVRCDSMDSCYLEDPITKRLYVLTPLGIPSPGTDYVVLHYKFMCKTSCMGGMNRRPIEVIFTLERQTGEVIGRAAVKVRICSCPRRDMNKEEVCVKTHKRQAEEEVESFSNKVVKLPKIEGDSYCHNIHHIPVVGDRNFLVSCAKLLRAHTVGEKFATGQKLTMDEMKNLANFNKIIGDVPQDGETD